MGMFGGTSGLPGSTGVSGQGSASMTGTPSGSVVLGGPNSIPPSTLEIKPVGPPSMTPSTGPIVLGGPNSLPPSTLEIKPVGPTSMAAPTVATGTAGANILVGNAGFGGASGIPGSYGASGQGSASMAASTVATVCPHYEDGAGNCIDSCPGGFSIGLRMDKATGTIVPTCGCIGAQCHEDPCDKCFAAGVFHCPCPGV